MLTQYTVQNTKPREKPYKLSDGNGLHLLVQTNGSRLWLFRYRFGGKEKMLSFGGYPDVPIAAAREKRNDARKLLAQDIDPSQKRKSDREAAQVAAQNTFGVLAAEYLANMEAQERAARTIETNRWYIEGLAKPLASRPITEITPAEILDLLKQVERSGRRETAKRLRGAIGSVFRLAIVTLRATNDPTYPLRGAILKPIVKHRPAITDERELGILWDRIQTYYGWPTIRGGLQFLMLTMTRPGKVRLMTWPEVDLTKSLWSIPAERMKMRRPHLVPLSRQAIAILEQIKQVSGRAGFVFPSIRSGKPLSDATFNMALRNMGYTAEQLVAHGFRASASTILNQPERGFHADVIEAALAHEDEDAVRRAYNRSNYFKERIPLMQAWADLLDQFRADSVNKAA
jgi:integrase